MAPTTKAVKGSRTAQAPFCGNIAKSSVERTRTAQAPRPASTQPLSLQFMLCLRNRILRGND